MADMSYRSSFIGGTDAAKIMGFSKYGNRDSVLREKVIGREHFSNNPIRIGVALEQTVAEMYEREKETVLSHPRKWMLEKWCSFDEHSPMTISERDDIAILARPLIHAGASIDRIDVINRRGVEIKTCKKDWKTADDVPDEYKFQCQHYMLVTEWPEWDIIGLNKFNDKTSIVTLKADYDLHCEMVDAYLSFWEDVEKLRSQI